VLLRLGLPLLEIPGCVTRGFGINGQILLALAARSYFWESML